MEKQRLFREAAMHSRRPQYLGRIFFVQPVSLTVIVVFSFLFSLSIGLFLLLGSYTKRTTVAGQLVPQGGMIKVYSTQAGIITEKYVEENKKIRKGDILYVVSTDRQSRSQGDTQAAISKQVEARRTNLQQEIEKTKSLQRSERAAAEQKIASLNLELQKISSQILNQKARFGLAQQARSRYRELRDQDYVSGDQLQQKEEDYLDQYAKLSAIERDQTSVARELAFQKTELTATQIKYGNQLSQLERELAQINQEFSESEAKRGLAIVAPESGTLTAESAQLGQAVTITRSLVNIVPQRSLLQAHLYIPSKAIGFVREGDEVHLRYQAYPYQKFGHGKGIVRFVSKVSLPSEDIPEAEGIFSSKEPLYRVVVDLAEQYVMAYGKPMPLQAGMLLEADVLQDKRRLYEWVLEPLYSLTGKME